MPERYEIEQLVIDDTFINYCFRRNAADIIHWEAYQAAHPEEAGTFAEARELVLGISLMLMEEVTEVIPLYNNSPKRSIRKVLAIAASVAVITTALVFIFRNSNQKQPIVAEQIYVFTTALAEKRTIKLPDSSTVILNAGSELLVDKAFNKQNRFVSLKGEALFEVEHNAERPFIVDVEGYDVKVLGTVFNVKAYPGEKKSETSLISGKVEIYLKHTTSAYKTLLPKEKFVIRKDLHTLPTSGSAPANVKVTPPATAILPLSYNRNQVNIETAWSQNRLVFENETFADIREKLERWFNVQIIFEDKTVEQYTFTATFEKEDIQQVIKALQASYGFKYSIQGKEVRISHQSASR